jgi:hypothetical protein
MDNTQKYIIKQNALTNANAFWQSEETKTEEKVLATAQQFADWVMGEEKKTYTKPFRPKLEENTPQFSEAIQYIQSGGKVEKIEEKYWLSNIIKSKLNKI